MRYPPIVRALQLAGAAVIFGVFPGLPLLGGLMLCALWYFLIEYAWDTRPRW